MYIDWFLFLFFDLEQLSDKNASVDYVFKINSDVTNYGSIIIIILIQNIELSL